MRIHMELPDEIREYFREQGRIGGNKRKRTLSPERRSELARIAAQARWKKRSDLKPKSIRKPIGGDKQ
jgi:hypothetical protein